MTIPALRHIFRKLAANTSGMALIEFAYSAPILLTMTMGGAELANYSVVSMRVNQIALQVADNGARIGEGEPLAVKKITEKQINDILTGAGIQAGTLNLFGNYTERPTSGAATTKAKGRVIISSVEPIANPNPTNKYKISWQRCRGAATHAPQYGVTGATNLNGVGPAGRQVTAPDGGAVIFVEVHYRYEPIFLTAFRVLDYKDLNTTAAMIVRDDRDYSTIYNTEAAAVSGCN